MFLVHPLPEANEQTDDETRIISTSTVKVEEDEQQEKGRLLPTVTKKEHFHTEYAASLPLNRKQLQNKEVGSLK